MTDAALLLGAQACPVCGEVVMWTPCQRCGARWDLILFESQSPKPPDLQDKAHTGFEPVFAPKLLTKPNTDNTKGSGREEL